jgi:hypothetical protein
VAIRELLRGGALFRDVFVQYGPLHYEVPALAFAVFGASLATLRGYFLAGEIATLLAAFVLARRAIASRGFAWAAALLVVVHAHHPFWSTRWGGFRFAFVYGTLAALLRAAETGRRGWLVAAGVLAALAFLHTYDAGAVAALGAAVFFAHEAWQRRGQERSARLSAIGSFAAGYGLALVPFLVQLVYRGTFGDYLDQLPLLDPGRAWPQPIAAQDLSPAVMAPGLVFAVGFATLVQRSLRGRWNAAQDLPLLLLCSCGALLYAAAFRAIRGPQFETSLPLAILVALQLIARGFAFARRDGRAPQRALVGAASALALLGFAGVEIRAYGGGLLSWGAYQRDKAERVPRYRGANTFDRQFRTVAADGCGPLRTLGRQAEEIEGVVAFLRAETRPDEPFFAFPDLGIFEVFADRPGITRFPVAILAAAREDWAREVADALAREKPRWVLRSGQLSTLARATRRRAEYLPAVGAYLDANYDRARSFGSLDLLRRRAAAPAAAAPARDVGAGS